MDISLLGLQLTVLLRNADRKDYNPLWGSYSVGFYVWLPKQTKLVRDKIKLIRLFETSDIQSRLKLKIAWLFLYSAGALLLVTAVAKFTSSFGHGRILLERDPLTNFQFRDLFRIVGGIETAVALVCIFSKRIWLPAGLVAWLATSFVVYRVGLLWVGYLKPCSCLGNLTDALHISPQTSDTAMKIILAYLLIGSYGTLFWLWRQRKKQALPA